MGERGSRAEVQGGIRHRPDQAEDDQAAGGGGGRGASTAWVAVTEGVDEAISVGPRFGEVERVIRRIVGALQVGDREVEQPQTARLRDSNPGTSRASASGSRGSRSPSRSETADVRNGASIPS